MNDAGMSKKTSSKWRQSGFLSVNGKPASAKEAGAAGLQVTESVKSSSKASMQYPSEALRTYTIMCHLQSHRKPCMLGPKKGDEKTTTLFPEQETCSGGYTIPRITCGKTLKE